MRTLLIIISLVAIVSSELVIELLGSNEVTINMVDTGAEESAEKENSELEESESDQEHKPFDADFSFSQAHNLFASALWFSENISIQYLEINSPPPEGQVYA